VRGQLVTDSDDDRPIDILLVEDNPGDVRLTREGLRETSIRNNLHVAKDGVEAMAFLRREGVYAQVARPDLIVLDLNLPRMDGREVLAQVKADAQLKTIPVIVFTTSRSEQDVMQSYELHANCFITKPVDLEQFINVMRTMHEFWLSTASRPV
jgi:CheY-like chemotaxis protein